MTARILVLLGAVSLIACGSADPSARVGADGGVADAADALGDAPPARSLSFTAHVGDRGVSEPVTFVVPPDTRSITVVVVGRSSSLLGLASFRTADATEHVGIDLATDPGPAMNESYQSELTGLMPGEGRPSTKQDNVAIPSAADPNGLVAPFWDDLDVAFSNARVGALGTAPNRRLVMAWNHWTIKGSTAIRVSFQAKLFETTNFIEFHYCGMNPTDDSQATGGSATIGLESLDGTKGAQFSFNTASSAKTGQALRFVPTP